MSAVDNKALIESFLRTYEAGDFDRLWTFYAEDCDYAVLERFGLEKSRERYRTFMQTFLAAFPDVHHDIQDIMAEDDRVWALYTVTGTHRGPLRGMEPTGKSVSYPIVGMYRVRDNKIVKADFVSDDLRMMRQLGYV